MSMLQFVNTSEADMHIHQWLHHLADGVCGAAYQRADYGERHAAVLAALRVLPVSDSHKRYIGSCAMAKLGHGGGL